MGYMPQNIDSTTRTIGLWCLAHKDEKYITTLDLTTEFPNVARPRISGVLSRFKREGYLTQISRGYYRVVEDNAVEFERRLKPSAKEIEIVPAIPVNTTEISIGLKGQLLCLNSLLAVGADNLAPEQYSSLFDYLDDYAKHIQGMVKFARMNLESFDAYPVTIEQDAAAYEFLKEHFA